MFSPSDTNTLKIHVVTLRHKHTGNNDKKCWGENTLFHKEQFLQISPSSFGQKRICIWIQLWSKETAEQLKLLKLTGQLMSVFSDGTFWGIQRLRQSSKHRHRLESHTTAFHTCRKTREMQNTNKNVSLYLLFMPQNHCGDRNQNNHSHSNSQHYSPRHSHDFSHNPHKYKSGSVIPFVSSEHECWWVAKHGWVWVASVQRGTVTHTCILDSLCEWILMKKYNISYIHSFSKMYLGMTYFFKWLHVTKWGSDKWRTAFVICAEKQWNFLFYSRYHRNWKQ